MGNPNLERVLREVLALDPAERKQLRDLLDKSEGSPSSGATERTLDEALIRAGLMTKAPIPITDLKPYEERRLAEAKGKPTSEILVEERR
ncbi:MAG: hypothetical protein HY721_14320 [Planctomycetes bacterium]|nr:hypothetical protein [Planctomycetota bacterium]